MTEAELTDLVAETAARLREIEMQILGIEEDGIPIPDGIREGERERIALTHAFRVLAANHPEIADRMRVHYKASFERAIPAETIYAFAPGEILGDIQARIEDAQEMLRCARLRSDALDAACRAERLDG